MAHKRKTWQEKLHIDRKPEVEVLDKDFGGMKAGTPMLISTPVEVDQFVRSIPKGKGLTIPEVREQLAKKHNAAGTCPLTTSIFLRISAEAALEELEAGKSLDEVTPFWRAIEPKSKVAEKLSCGKERLQALRAAEGL